MQRRKYTIDDVNFMDWVEFGEVLESLIQKLDKYQLDHNIHFDIVAPILRSGGIPAAVIANRFGILRFLPVQVKYVYSESDPTKSQLKQVLSLPEIFQDTPSSPNILVCDCNTSTGESAKKSIAIIKDRYPDATIYNATVAKVFGGPDNLDNVKEYFWGVQTNEFFKADDVVVEKLGLRPKITVFPWETIGTELFEINSD